MLPVKAKKQRSLYHVWDPKDMQEAIRACLKGEMTPSIACRAYKLPYSTFRVRYHKAKQLNQTPDEVPLQNYHRQRKTIQHGPDRHPAPIPTQGNSKHQVINGMVDTELTHVIRDLLSSNNDLVPYWAPTSSAPSQETYTASGDHVGTWNANITQSSPALEITTYHVPGRVTDLMQELNADHQLTHSTEGASANLRNEAFHDRVPEYATKQVPSEDITIESILGHNKETYMNTTSPESVPTNQITPQEINLESLLANSKQGDRIKTTTDRLTLNSVPNYDPSPEPSSRNILTYTEEMDVPNLKNVPPSWQAPLQELSLRNSLTNTGSTVLANITMPNSFLHSNVPGHVLKHVPEHSVNQVPVKDQSMQFILTSTEEAEITNMIVNISSRLYGVDTEDIRRFTYEYAESMKLRKEFPMTYYSKKTGAQWAFTFTIRNPPLQNLDKNYAADSTEKTLTAAFFRKLGKICRNKRIQPNRIFNTDLYAVSLTQRTEIVEMRGRNLRIMFSKPNNFATFQVCSNAEGDFMPPKIIFPKNRLSMPLVALQKGTAELENSGMMSANLFLKWFSEFVILSKPTANSPVLLILDARFDYLRTLEFFKRAKENHVEILCFPPNTAHIQPLDVSFFSIMRDFYNKAVQNFFKFRTPDSMEQNDQVTKITLENIATLFNYSYTRAATKEIGMDGFRNTGIHPFNPQHSIPYNSYFRGQGTNGGSRFTETDLVQPTTTQSTEIDEETEDRFVEIAAFLAKRFSLKR